MWVGIVLGIILAFVGIVIGRLPLVAAGVVVIVATFVRFLVFGR